MATFLKSETFLSKQISSVPLLLSLGLVFSCFSLVSGLAWGSAQDAGTSGAAWLAEPPSSRLLALGGAGAAGTQDVESWFWNPASIAGCPEMNAELALRKHLLDSEIGFFNLAWPTAWGVPAVGFTYTQTQAIQGFDEVGNSTGNFATDNWALKFGWAYVLGQLGLGISGTWFNQNWHSARDWGWGTDLGAVYTLSPTLRLGAAVLHLGSTQEGDPLPLEGRLGIRDQVLPSVALQADAALPRDNDPYFALGCEWTPWGPLALRAGCHNGPLASSQLGAVTYFSAGLGVKVDSFTFNYAYEPSGVLGDSHHLDIVYCYGNQSLPREGDLNPLPAVPGRVVLTPRLPATAGLRGLTVLVKARDGQVVKTFNFSSQEIPRELAWDGKDDSGRPVDLKQNFTFTYEVRPEPKPAGEGTGSRLLKARKLRFPAGGDAVEPEVLFTLTGKTGQIRSWRLVILDRETGREIRTLSGQQPVTAVEWDGKDETGKWAPADRLYQCRWEETVADGSRAGESYDLAAVPAEVVSRSGSRVKFKILQVLFKFNRADLPPEAEDQLQKAAEINRRRGPVIRQLEGYTDEVGTEAANRALSLQRAQAVKTYLEKEKVWGNVSVPLEGLADKHPREQGHAAAARAQNRRVEILLEVPEQKPPKE